MSYSTTLSAPDSVRGDIESLASHMGDCERAQSRWSGLSSGLQHAHSVTACRLVTVGCVISALALGVFVLV